MLAWSLGLELIFPTKLLQNLFDKYTNTNEVCDVCFINIPALVLLDVQLWLNLHRLGVYILQQTSPV